MRKKVLIIEDNPKDAKLAKDYLTSDDFEINLASTGEEGVDKAVDIKPDLIILDLMLPDISGFDVCEKIREHQELNDTIVVIMSAKSELDDISKGFACGADDYVLKYPSPELLKRKIRLYLGLKVR